MTARKRKAAAAATKITADSALPPVCHFRDPISGHVLRIDRGNDRAEFFDTLCSAECLNNALPCKPTENDVSPMRAGVTFGWDSPGADPEHWRRRRALHDEGEGYRGCAEAGRQDMP